MPHLYIVFVLHKSVSPHPQGVTRVENVYINRSKIFSHQTRGKIKQRENMHASQQ